MRSIHCCPMDGPVCQILTIQKLHEILKIFFFNSLDWNSALFIILNGTKEEHLDMLDGGIIQRLLEEKWKTFARVIFDVISISIICIFSFFLSEPISEAAAHFVRASVLPIHIGVYATNYRKSS